MTGEGQSAPEGRVMSYDGVAVLRRGDAMLVCYQKDACLERTCWLFDVIDRAALAVPQGLIGMLVVLDTAEPPDGPTRDENTKRLARLGTGVRRLVTVPLGDAFRTAIVRTLMRALNLALGHSKHRIVSDTIDEGLSRLLEAASPSTPKRLQLQLDLETLFAALGVADALPARSIYPQAAGR